MASAGVSVSLYGCVYYRTNEISWAVGTGVSFLGSLGAGV